MTAEIAVAVGELADRVMRDALHSSVTDNVEVMIDQLTHSKEMSDLPPLPHAHRYAEELARRNVPESSLRRAYHVGSHYLLARIFDQVQEIDCPPHEQSPLYRHLAGWLYQYIDAITRQVIATYQEEQRSSHERAARTTFTWVTRVLEAEDVSLDEFFAATRYRLDQAHVACRVWVDDRADQATHPSALATLIDQVHAMLGGRDDPLVVVTGRHEADVWFGGVHRVDTRAFDMVVASAGGSRLAFGSPGFGPAGFRASRSQASRIAHVTSDPTARVTSYADEGIPVISRLVDDLPATRAWVHDVLGELAVDQAPQPVSVTLYACSSSPRSATQRRRCSSFSTATRFATGWRKPRYNWAAASLTSLSTRNSRWPCAASSVQSYSCPTPAPGQPAHHPPRGGMRATGDKPTCADQDLKRAAAPLRIRFLLVVHSNGLGGRS